MASSVSDRSSGDADAISRAVAEACKAQEWSKGIRLLNKLPDTITSPRLLCNRAWCYSKLELHKHVIKDCDKALELNPSTLEAYLYKGQALAALNRTQEACQVWEQGCNAAQGLSTELPLVVELHMLAMQAQSSGLLMHTATAVAQPPITTIKSSSRGMTTTVVSSAKKNKGAFFSPLNLDSDVIEHIEGGPRNKQLNHHGLQSLTLDIRLSKGIGQVNRGNYEEAISIFNMLLEENPKSCDALLGRGTAYAFLRNLESAITDFSKAIEVDPTVGEAWKRRGQARAAIGATTKALEDLTKAMELEPGSADLLHERG